MTTQPTATHRPATQRHWALAAALLATIGLGCIAGEWTSEVTSYDDAAITPSGSAVIVMRHHYKYEGGYFLIWAGVDSCTESRFALEFFDWAGVQTGTLALDDYSTVNGTYASPKICSIDDSLAVIHTLAKLYLIDMATRAVVGDSAAKAVLDSLVDKSVGPLVPGQGLLVLQESWPSTAAYLCSLTGGSRLLCWLPGQYPCPTASPTMHTNGTTVAVYTYDTITVLDVAAGAVVARSHQDPLRCVRSFGVDRIAALRGDSLLFCRWQADSIAFDSVVALDTAAHWWFSTDSSGRFVVANAHWYESTAWTSGVTLYDRLSGQKAVLCRNAYAQE